MDDQPQVTNEVYQAAAEGMRQADIAEAERTRRERVILGRLAAFGRFAFPTRAPRTPRHADTWRDQGPHASARECERRVRQAAHQQR